MSKRRIAGLAVLLALCSAPSPGLAQEDWSEPEVAQSAAGGRDAEARRRLSELETKIRKMEGRQTKADEEREDKFAFDWSGKFKVQGNVRDDFNLGSPLQRWGFDNRAFTDYRFQLRLDAHWKAWQVVALLDKGNFMFDWKEDSEGTMERWGEFLTVRYPFFRELYLQYTGPLVMQAGRANLALGNGIVLEGPVDQLRLSYPAGVLPGPRTLRPYLPRRSYNSYADFRRPVRPRNRSFSGDTV